MQRRLTVRVGQQLLPHVPFGISLSMDLGPASRCSPPSRRGYRSQRIKDEGLRGLAVVFKRRGTAGPVPTDPEHLYRLLGTSPTAPASLWSQQADVLREWHSSHLSDRDVALELPTGAGKTLVGGLIAEFRRRSEDARVAYLCPTNQLAAQTHAQLMSYGLAPVLLTGRSDEWNRLDENRFMSGQAIAVSNYSHVFNSNPGLSECQYLVLDDAHAADGYVASPWRMELPRTCVAYQDVLSALRDAIDPLVHARLTADSPDGQYFSDVYLASPEGVREASAHLEALLDSASTSGALPTDARFTLRTLRGHIDRCLVYLSYATIQIRPLVPPTATHDAFERAQQRVYMSATLGAGGELERAFGRQRIRRIPAPRGWDKQGTGRRFFVVPELTRDLSDDGAGLDEWVAGQISSAKRAIVLTPDKRTADRFKANRVAAGTRVFEARDIETDLAPFLHQSNAALVLTNRYDGVDLSGDACRLVIIDSLPAKGDLQERFLQSSLGALEVLQERVRARITQGAGRASRHARDYSVVILLGSELIKFVNRRETLGALYPEVRAELEFGLDQSMSATVGDLQARIDTFLKQDDHWRDAEVDISDAREVYERVDPLGTTQLAQAAPHEVAAWVAAWSGNWTEALAQAKLAIDALQGGRAPQRYAALWNYLAAAWASRLHASNGGQEHHSASQTYFSIAQRAGRGTRWLNHLESPADRTLRSATVELDPLDALACDAITRLINDGRWSRGLEERLRVIRTGLLAADAEPFEQSLVTLGELLGADSIGDGDGDANPDATWVFHEVMWICWEAKSEARTDTEVSVDTARQASGHLAVAADRRSESAPPDSFTVLVTPQRTAHRAGRALASENVFAVAPNLALEIADRVRRALLKVSPLSGSADPESVRLALEAEQALPSQLLPLLRRQPLGTFVGD